MSRKYTKTERRVIAGILVSPLVIGLGAVAPQVLGGLVAIILCAAGITVLLSTLEF